MDNPQDTVAHLKTLNLSDEEARIYLELLREPSSHLQLARITGINRTKVYRVVGLLEKRSLVTRRTDDRGTFLIASDPKTLEVALITKQEQLKQQQQILRTLIPSLTQLQGKDTRSFVVQTYEGQAGLKQMCWHELRTEGELLGLGNGTIEQITSDPRWAAKQRQRQIAGGYRLREIVNYDYYDEILPPHAAKTLTESGLYTYRILPPDILTFDIQTVVYNDTVAIYHWKQDQKVGVEIVSPLYAQMMRQNFEHFWRLADGATLLLQENKTNI